jgi:plasmid stabilization system protein ParE
VVSVTVKPLVQWTGNFERDLEEIESFLISADASQAFDALLDELSDTVILNLETFPKLGRLFFERSVGSVEARHSLMRLTQQLSAIGQGVELREYVMTHYLVLYARANEVVYLLSIRHQKQLSFDFDALWPSRR